MSKIFSDSRKMLYLFESTLIAFLILAFNFNSVITRLVITIVLTIFAIIATVFLKNDKHEFIYKNQIITLMLTMAIIYVFMLYIMGIYFGFYNSTISFGLWSIKKYIIPYIFLIISSEIIRKNILLRSDNKISKILITLALIMLDVILATDLKNLKSLEDYVTVLGFVIFATIANNILYNYIVTKFNTNIPTIAYKLITTLYVFIFPITPDIYVFFESIIRMVYPYLIYLLLDKLYNNEEKRKVKRITKKQIISTTLVGIFTCMVVMLVSCKFTYSVLVIGSGSMTGTINKGDIIFYKKYDNKLVEIGEILVFDNGEATTIHRVINKKKYGNEIRYYTKGDANLQEDSGYIKSENIIGRYLWKIPYIGYMNLWISDLFNVNS